MSAGRMSRAVYPRVCGGTPGRYSAGHSDRGLSLRVRGNQRLYQSSTSPGGSIPACAGEPARPAFQCGPGRVYPRVCGGTFAAQGAPRGDDGLSPRVRGNPIPGVRPPGRRRSIPACAGEPGHPGKHQPWTEVYPRVCGGTRSAASSLALACGLSPRVRGNRRRWPVSASRRGSIPACAGEPDTAGSPHWTRPVYPRVCGGTRPGGAGRPVPLGLSPRVRGNHRNRRVRRVRAGSIPACAGEPSPRSPAGRTFPVYPRVCGGTPSGGHGHARQVGLSPRVRGNRLCARVGLRRIRSIPACAGEPRGGDDDGRTDQVYPRVCGGTTPAWRTVS